MTNLGRLGLLFLRGRLHGEVPVHGGAGDSEHLRDVSGRDALFPQLAGLGGVGGVDLAWASALAPVGCRSGQPGAGPHVVDRGRLALGQPVGSWAAWSLAAVVTWASAPTDGVSHFPKDVTAQGSSR